MTTKLRVSFNSPQSGFMSIGLKAGKANFVTAVAHLPYDSLRDLINALTALLSGATAVTVKWNREPEEYDFEVHRSGDAAVLNIIRYPNHRRVKRKSETVFSHKASVVSICGSFFSALDELYKDKDTDEFDKNWRREFPGAEFRELTDRMSAAKLKSSEIKGADHAA